MITAAVKALAPARWVAADEAYGNNTSLRARLRQLRRQRTPVMLVPAECC